jgi:uncharacterized phage protein (TIGR01671 family)
MGEIKFRQALFDFGVFCGWHYWGFINGEFILPARSSNYGIQAANKYSQQFTGLKDKNGTEIYQGDIIRMENEDGDVLIIKFIWDEGDEERFWCGWVAQTIADVTEEIYDEYGNAPLDWDGAPEVIGNIYENPELLKN